MVEESAQGGRKQNTNPRLENRNLREEQGETGQVLIGPGFG